MKINILFATASGYKPIGGYKVLYEYANRLAKDGHEIIIYYPCGCFATIKGIKKIKVFFMALLQYISKKIYLIPYKCEEWFELNSNIKEKLVFSLKSKNIENGDIIFATSWRTAPEINKYSNLKGRKYYFIQSFEDWSGTKEEVIQTWKMPFKKIVISQHLKDIADNLGEEAEYIENGLDHNVFYKKKNLKKIKNKVMMLYHSNEKVKQSNKALNEVIKLKEKIKDLEVVLFGVNKRPDSLPEWVEYHHKPSKNKLNNLYNSSSLFISPSKIEGWALPPAEAMQCGTCVCVTDIGGHEYVKHLVNGYRIHDSLETLNSVIEELLKDNKLRNKLALEGNKYIKRFTWDSSVKKIKKYLEIY